MRKTLQKIQSVLLKRQLRTEAELKAIQAEDPVFSDKDSIEAGESGADSWRNDAHTNLTAARLGLQGMLARIKKALLSIKQGTYGLCENCGLKIEPARLKAMPEAIFCLHCSTKLTKS